jgi:hypothetical protein
MKRHRTARRKVVTMPKDDLVIKLKKFAKDREIYDKHLKGIEFIELSDTQAEELLEKCK